MAAAAAEEQRRQWQWWRGRQREYRGGRSSYNLRAELQAGQAAPLGARPPRNRKPNPNLNPNPSPSPNPEPNPNPTPNQVRGRLVEAFGHEAIDAAIDDVCRVVEAHWGK